MWHSIIYDQDFHLILKPQKLQNCLNFAIMSIECLMTPSSTPSWLLSKEIGYDFSADTSTYNAAVSLLRPLSQQFHHFISLYFTSLHSIALGAGYSKISPIHILHSVLCALIWRKVSTQSSYFFEKCFTGCWYQNYLTHSCCCSKHITNVWRLKKEPDP